jgi:diguanylate cyclase (GGDEF) domain
MLHSLLTLDVRTLMVVLFLGNSISVALILAYYWRGESESESRISDHYLPAKICQALAYLLLMSRGMVPDIVSVNLGNTFLMFGFYLEALAMLASVNENGVSGKILAWLTFLCIAAFNVIEFTRPDSSLRVAVASLCVFLILVIPSVRLFVSVNSTRFKRWVGVFYLLFLALLLPRAFFAFVTDMDILTSSPIQILTFLALVLLLVYSLPSYLLMMKENADRVIAAMASTDQLTMLSNRYYFLETAERAFSRLRFDAKSMAILFLDIDHFKGINDTYGHAFGDRVLVTLGKVIRECVRPTDLTCRYGGEEFIVLLPDATKVQGFRVAERIREAIQKAEFPDNPGFSFRVSVGITDGVPEQDDSLDLYMNRAESALYTAKKSGRDQIVEYDPVSTFVDI